MDWFKDEDAVWCRYVSPTETITAGFGFSLGQDANCVRDDELMMPFG